MVRIILAALALAACSTTPAPSRRATLNVYGDRLFVDATVNGSAVEALLDSGAEISFADAAWAASRGLETAGSETVKGSGGTDEVSFAENVSLETLGLRFDGLTIAVLDLSDISSRLVGRPVNFIIGRELFDRERWAIDIEAGAIAVADKPVQPNGVELPLTASHGIESVKARVNGEVADAEFDLGNGSGLLIGKAFAERLHLLDDPASLETRKGGGIGGELERKIVRLASVEVAGVTFSNLEAAVDETETAADLNIGVGLLRNFRITTDFSARKIWLEKR